jgi:acetylornithine/N-succinyldiaminopimelate aminotransferase
MSRPTAHPTEGAPGLHDPRGALLGVYRPPETLFVAGRGSELFDAEGRAYLDFTSGIGVNALGYDVPEVRAAVEEVLDSGLIHSSNLFRTRPAEELAELLVRTSFPGRVFFCNSGAEAGEAAFKFARRHARATGSGAGKHEIVAFRGGFHGRLFGTLAATDRPSYQEPFQPLMPGVHFCDVGDIEGVLKVVSKARTAAVVIEPVQGEGGVVPVPHAFLRALREICTEHEVALVFDEVQCGIGRTGELFAFQEAGVVPDMVTLAKPLAGGLPMGAVLLSEAIAASVEPGDHATTFGGGPLVASVALAVVRRIADESFLAGVRERGQALEGALRQVAARRDGVEDVRGVGLMWGVAIGTPAADVASRARELGLLLVPAGPRVVRLLPPLTVTADEIDRAVQTLEEALP